MVDIYENFNKYVVFSEDSYGKDVLPQNNGTWTRINDLNLPGYTNNNGYYTTSSGFGGAAYKNLDTGEIIIAYRCTPTGEIIAEINNITDKITLHYQNYQIEKFIFTDATLSLNDVIVFDKNLKLAA